MKGLIMPNEESNMIYIINYKLKNKEEGEVHPKYFTTIYEAIESAMGLAAGHHENKISNTDVNLMAGGNIDTLIIKLDELRGHNLEIQRLTLV